MTILDDNLSQEAKTYSFHIAPIKTLNIIFSLKLWSNSNFNNYYEMNFELNLT